MCPINCGLLFLTVTRCLLSRDSSSTAKVAWFVVNMWKLYLLFVMSVNCDLHGEAVPYSYKLDDFVFFPEKHTCYEIYDKSVQINQFICREPLRRDRLSCLQPLQDKLGCFITTPSNETILFPNCVQPIPPYSSAYFSVNDYSWGYNNAPGSNCFTVHKGGKMKVVCPKVVDKYSIAITTPDKYTVLLNSHYCSTAVRTEDLKKNEEFVKDFNVDADGRSCYKIYGPNQVISSHTSMAENLQEACVEIDQTNCTILTTPNNETILLGCQEDGDSIQKKCVKIRTADQISTACLKQFDDACVGITTPSGLMVNFGCRVYMKYKNGVLHNKNQLKEYRHFVKTFLAKENKRKNNYLTRHFFEASNTTQSWMGRRKIYPYWLPNTNCYAITTLDTNETVTLQCTDQVTTEPGCFEIAESKKIVCAQIFEEKCVGIQTPKNAILYLDCFEDPSRDEKYRKEFIDQTILRFKKGDYPSLNNQYTAYEVYKTEPGTCKKTSEVYVPGVLQGHNRCLGFVTPALETVVLECPGQKPKNPSCFDVYTPKRGANGDIVDSSQEENERCVQTLDEKCIGIITPLGWKIQLICYAAGGGAFGGGIFNPKSEEPTDMI